MDGWKDIILKDTQILSKGSSLRVIQDFDWPDLHSWEGVLDPLSSHASLMLL